MFKILVCEPDDLMRVLLREWLDGAGYDVFVAETPPSRAPTPDLIIVNILLPRRDCAATVDALRSLYPAVPVIAMSARFRAGAGDAAAARDALGVRGMLAKPFTRECLLATVRDAIATTT